MSETEQKIEPALTAEEWLNATVQIEEGYDNEYAIAQLSEMDDADGPILQIWPKGASPVDGFACCGRELHQIAALCLHGQSFGFTWEDVENLRTHGGEDICQATIDELDSVADRIAALLPPRDLDTAKGTDLV